MHSVSTMSAENEGLSGLVFMVGDSQSKIDELILLFQIQGRQIT